MPKSVSAKYCQENKEKLQKRAPQRYQNLSKEKYEKRQQYDRYKILSEDENQKLYISTYIEKILQIEKKCPFITIRNICFKNNYLESSFDQGYKAVLKKSTLKLQFFFRKLI